MGLKVEFNPDLALRNISEFKKGGGRKKNVFRLASKKAEFTRF